MKFICQSCKFVDPCVLDIGNDIELQPTFFVCPKKPRNENCKWEELPKLTAEVFSREDCPAWAKYAIVGVSGMAIFSDIAPVAKNEIMWFWEREPKQKTIPGVFDSSDWKNSLIERPEKKTLPDWCKPGEWLYLLNGKYYKIESIDEYGVELSVGIHIGRNSIHKEAVAARYRPFNADEMKALVGKVIDKPYGSLLVTAYAESDCIKIHTDYGWYTADYLLTSDYTIDGKPCGVLEHKNEKGEWVK